MKPNEEVICINNTPDGGCHWPIGKRPILYKIYTVREIGLYGEDYHEEPCISLIELPMYVYRTSRFIPLSSAPRPTHTAHAQSPVDGSAESV